MQNKLFLVALVVAWLSTAVTGYYFAQPNQAMEDRLRKLEVGLEEVTDNQFNTYMEVNGSRNSLSDRVAALEKITR